MDQEGSTPDLQGGQDHSPIEQSADNVVNQPSNEEATQQPESQNQDEGFFQDQNNQEEQEQTSETSDGAPSQSTDVPDDGLKQWATNQGYSLNTPSEIAMAKRIRNGQQSFHQEQQKQNNESKQKFNEAVASQETGDLSDMQRKIARMEFFDAHPDARELEGAMYDIAVEAYETGDTAGFDYYQSPKGWNTLLQLAKARAAENQSDEQYQAGRKDERTNLAKKQQASIATPAANDPKPSSGKLTDEQIGRMSQSEYEAFRRNNPNWNPFS